MYPQRKINYKAATSTPAKFSTKDTKAHSEEAALGLHSFFLLSSTSISGYSRNCASEAYIYTLVPILRGIEDLTGPTSPQQQSLLSLSPNSSVDENPSFGL